MTPKVFPKAGYGMYTVENWPVKEKESKNRNSDAAFKTVFKISEYFQKSNQKLLIIFLFHKGV